MRFLTSISEFLSVRCPSRLRIRISEDIEKISRNDIGLLYLKICTSQFSPSALHPDTPAHSSLVFSMLLTDIALGIMEYGRKKRKQLIYVNVKQMFARE